jgi:hypothetical protein
MTPSGLALSESKKPKTGEFSGMQLLDVQRLTGLVRHAVPASKAGYVFSLPLDSARQTSTTGAQMRAEKVMEFASSVELGVNALQESLDIFRLHFSRSEAMRGAAPVAAAPVVRQNVVNPSAPAWVLNLSAGSEVSDVVKTIDALFQYLQRHDFDALNESICLVDVTQSNHVHLVAVLRALFISRKKLANWRKMRDDTFSEIRRRGKNAERIMAGLHVD